MKKFLAILFLPLALLALSSDLAMAQPSTPPGVATLAGTATLAVSATSARVPLPAAAVPFNAITIVNTGTKDAFIVQGGATVAATTSAPFLRAGKRITIAVTGSYVAAICGGSDSTTLDIYQANGAVGFGP